MLKCRYEQEYCRDTVCIVSRCIQAFCFHAPAPRPLERNQKCKHLSKLYLFPCQRSWTRSLQYYTRLLKWEYFFIYRQAIPGYRFITKVVNFVLRCSNFVLCVRLNVIYTSWFACSFSCIVLLHVIALCYVLNFLLNPINNIILCTYLL